MKQVFLLLLVAGMLASCASMRTPSSQTNNEDWRQPYSVSGDWLRTVRRTASNTAPLSSMKMEHLFLKWSEASGGTTTIPAIIG